MGRCNNRGVSGSDPLPDDCWTTGGAISVLHSLHPTTPASVCAVFFWPRGEAILRQSASQAYTAGILNAAQNAHALGLGPDRSVIDLSILAVHIFHWFDDHMYNLWGIWARLPQPRAVLIVPDDAGSGSKLSNGHIFDQSFTLEAQMFPGIFHPVPMRVLVLGPAQFAAI